MAAPVTRPSAPPRVRHPHAASVRAKWLGVAALILQSACYSGDFFDDLVDPSVTAAFRIKTLTLIDPHFYAGDAVCDDVTNDYNEIWTAHLDAFEINPTLVLSPLDPKVTMTTKMQIVPAECVPGEDGVNCTDRDVPKDKIVEVTFSNSLQGGMCGGPVTGSLNPLYMAEQYEQLHAPQSPCLASAIIGAFELPLAPSFNLPLANVQISAAYKLDQEPQQLIEGVLFGFLSAAQGQMVLGTLNANMFKPWDVLAGATGCQPDPNAFLDDIDTVAASHDGVWMYFNFTAERVAWTPVMPDIEPPI